MGFRSVAIAMALFCWATVESQQSRPPFWQPDVACEMCLDGVCYGIQKLLNKTTLNIGDPIAMDMVENIIYYHTGRAIDSLNLTDQTTKTIKYGVDRTGLAVDQATRNLYFHSGTKIFKFNPVTEQLDKIYLSTSRGYVKNLYFHDKLYADVRFKLHTLNESKLELFEPLQNMIVTDNIVIDKRGDLYFVKSFDTYVLPAGSTTPVKLNDTRNVVVSTDKDGVVYFTHKKDKLIYRMNYSTNSTEEVGVFDVLVFGHEVKTGSVHFDKYNNVVYVNHNLYLNYLTPNAGRCRKRETTSFYGVVYPTIEKLS